jgi:chemotaxis methyl-accepting protein methylase
MNAALAALAALVHRESGIIVEEPQYSALEAALRRAHPGVGAPRFLELVASPAADPGLVARLLDETTIKETFFLRDAQQLERIDWRALVQQARREGSGHVRVWSAACATGEEPYSLAMLACEDHRDGHLGRRPGPRTGRPVPDAQRAPYRAKSSRTVLSRAGRVPRRRAGAPRARDLRAA